MQRYTKIFKLDDPTIMPKVNQSSSKFILGTKIEWNSHHQDTTIQGLDVVIQPYDDTNFHVYVDIDTKDKTLIKKLSALLEEMHAMINKWAPKPVNATPLINITEDAKAHQQRIDAREALPSDNPLSDVIAEVNDDDFVYVAKFTQLTPMTEDSDDDEGIYEGTISDLISRMHRETWLPNLHAVANETTAKYGFLYVTSKEAFDDKTIKALAGFINGAIDDGNFCDMNGWEYVHFSDLDKDIQNDTLNPTK